MASERNDPIPHHTLSWRFLRTRDEGSFNGFKGGRSDNDSDLDHGGLEEIVAAQHQDSTRTMKKKLDGLTILATFKSLGM